MLQGGVDEGGGGVEEMKWLIMKCMANNGFLLSTVLLFYFLFSPLLIYAFYCGLIPLFKLWLQMGYTTDAVSYTLTFENYLNVYMDRSKLTYTLIIS